jgi:hypothetical protein
LDGGRASSAMEIEAVQKIAAMFGWSTYLGHLTGGGTMANLEALPRPRLTTPTAAWRVCWECLRFPWPSIQRGAWTWRSWSACWTTPR